VKVSAPRRHLQGPTLRVDDHLHDDRRLFERPIGALALQIAKVEVNLFYVIAPKHELRLVHVI
jgi:hypothetical protein